MKILVSLLIVTILFTLGCDRSSNDEGSAVNAGGTADASVKRIKPERDSKVVARVNGVPIYEDEVKDKPLKSLITDEILYQDGLNRGLLHKYENQVMAFQMSLIVNDVKRSILEDMPPSKQITNEDIDEYYKKSIDKYRYAHLQEINSPDKNLAEEIKQMAAEGKDLQDIANKYSESGTEITVNDLGYNKALLTHFSDIEQGSITDIIEKRDGTFSILKILEVKERPLQNSKAAIKSSLEARRRAMAITNYANKVAEESGMNVEILDNPGENKSSK